LLSQRAEGFAFSGNDLLNLWQEGIAEIFSSVLMCTGLRQIIKRIHFSRPADEE
jgi:hypothetical protein